MYFYIYRSINGGSGTEVTALISYYVQLAVELPYRKKRQLPGPNIELPEVPEVPDITSPDVTDFIGGSISSVIDPSILQGAQTALDDVNDWVMLETLMVENIITVLNLTETEATLVKIAEAGLSDLYYNSSAETY